MLHQRTRRYCFVFLIVLFASCQENDREVEYYGAKGDGITDNTSAIQKAIDACHAKGGGELVFSRGTYLSGTLHLKSNVTLQITHPAVLKAIPKADAFPLIQGSIPSRMDKVPWKAFIRAEGVENITLTGNGTIDGSGDADVFKDAKGDSPDRPYGLLIINSKNIVVENLRLQSSAYWMQRYFHCTGVRITGLNVFNHVNKNNDGLDIDSSEDVIISDCIIDSSDDAIAIKSESERPSKNIVISNCIVSSHASAIKFGTGSIGGFENISITNIIIRKSKSEAMLHPLQLKNGMTGIDIGTVDGGALRNVLISNVVMEKVENPIHIRLGNRMSTDIGEQDGEHGSTSKTEKKRSSVIEDISITNIKAYDVGPYPIVITGYEEHPVKRIRLRDISIHASRGGSTEDITAAINWEPHWYPFILIYNSRMPAYGIVTNFTEDLLLENFNVIPAEGDPRPMIVHLNRK